MPRLVDNSRYRFLTLGKAENEAVIGAMLVQPFECGGVFKVLFQLKVAAAAQMSATIPSAIIAP